MTMLIVQVVHNSIKSHDKSHDRLLLEFDCSFQARESYTKVHSISISKLLDDDAFSNNIRFKLRQSTRLR